MSCFKYNRVNFVATERLILFGRRKFQRTLRTGCRPAIKSEDDIAGEVISNTARANPDPLATQVLEIAYAGIGASGVGYNVTRDVILEAYGWTTSDPEHVLEFAPAEQNLALCSGKVDAIIFEAGHPNGLTQEATTDCRARLVRVAGHPIDGLLATHPYYIATIIPGGMYVGNPSDVPTIGTRAVLIASSDQPDQLVYAIVKAVFDNFGVFRQLHPALSSLEMREMVPSDSVIPIHPGALNYYREKGLIHS
jgi:uncharacterized protein